MTNEKAEREAAEILRWDPANFNELEDDDLVEVYIGTLRKNYQSVAEVIAERDKAKMQVGFQKTSIAALMEAAKADAKRIAELELPVWVVCKCGGKWIQGQPQMHEDGCESANERMMKLEDLCKKGLIHIGIDHAQGADVTTEFCTACGATAYSYETLVHKEDCPAKKLGIV